MPFNIAIILAFSFSICLGQEIDPDSNWFREIKGIDDVYTRFDLNRYTINDVEKAKNKYLQIEQTGHSNIWEGIYTRGTETGDARLHWNSTDGFVYFYVYHTLGSLDYGSMIDTGDSIKMTSEKEPDTKSRPGSSYNLIKVKFGNKHFLVPENRLKDFLERAVGLNTELGDFTYYWYKVDEVDNTVSGFPVVPKRYVHLVRQPINTQVSKIGKRIVHQNKFDDRTVNYEEIHRYVILGSGKKSRIKPGMNFFVDELGEWVEITKVQSNRSIGRLRRGLDEDNKEICRNMERGQGDTVLCKDVKVGMKAGTKTSYHYF